MATAAPLPSDEELLAKLNALPEHLKGEIIDGELFVQPRPRFRHARANAFFSRDLGGPVDMDEDGPGGWWILLGPGIELPGAPEVSPDVGGWRRARMPEPPAEGDPITLAPDWVCEVLSPSNRRWDLKKKFPFYARVGVPWLWVVDPPAMTVSVRRLVAGAWTIVTEIEGDETVELEPFGGVALPFGRLWIPSKSGQ
jgi:Uma2 family endonuclease